MFCALSDKEPNITRYINKYIALAPIVYMNNTPNPLIKKIAAQPWVDGLFNLLGIEQILPYLNWQVNLQVLTCGIFPSICKTFFGLVMGGPTDLISYNRISVIMGHVPGATSK